MGCCLSKTNPSPPPISNVEPETSHPENEPQKPQMETKMMKPVTDEVEEKEEHRLEQEEGKEKLGIKDREGFVIQHRKSHDKRSEPNGLHSDSDGLVQIQSTNSSHPEPSDPKSPECEGIASKIIAMAANGAVVRTSSCTKEEVEAILIQCGRLSRSSSGKCGGYAASDSGRKYSGSKKSHDFDKENNNNVSTDGPAEADDDERQSRGSHRRTTPSRSRERDPHSQKSSSRERPSSGTGGGSGGRRVSRSPGRRSESPNTAISNGGGRPGKMVSVPASKSSLSMEKSYNGASGEGAATSNGSVKRVLVKRNVSEGLGGSRAATPPRSRSPARSALVGAAAGVTSHPSPIRNSSRKSEHSPYRRTPLTDLDINSLSFQPLANKSTSIKGQPLNSRCQNKLGAVQGNHRRARSRGGEGSDLAQVSAEHDELAAAPGLTRSRSSRRSRDFDVSTEGLPNPKPAANYNSLLLQDIQNFHQKAGAAPPFKLPECVSKACSIVEAVADLNLNSSSSRPVGRGNVGDELTEPSLHKFVTVGAIDGEFDEQESTGSNSFVTSGGGGQSQWVSSCSSWDEGVSPASFQRLAAASSNPRSGMARARTGSAGR